MAIIQRKIAVIGSGSGNIRGLEDIAYSIGREIAIQGHVLTNGTCEGISESARKGAYEAGGTVIGYSPALDITEHVEGFRFPHPNRFTEIVYRSIAEKSKSRMARLGYRAIDLAEGSDACIAIAGGTGTEIELLNFYKLNKVIGLVLGTGGIADKAVDRYLRENDRHFVLLAPDDLGLSINLDVFPYNNNLYHRVKSEQEMIRKIVSLIRVD